MVQSVKFGLTALLAVALLAPGCSSRRVSHQWNQRVLEAARLHDDGKLREAERRYRELLESAPKDEGRRAVLVKLAQLEADRGERRSALARYRSVWSQEVRDAHGARAMREAAELLDDPTERREMRRRLVIRYPASSWAEKAVKTLAADVCERHCEKLASWTTGLHEEVKGTPVADNLYFAAAGQLVDAGRTDAAVDLYRRQLRHYPDGTMADDAEWELARIFVRRQAWSAALPYLERVAARVKISWAIGTYNSPWASRARYQLGWVHLTHLDDYEAAVEHFEHYLKDFPRNRLADDALWHIAQAHRLAGRLEDRDAALERLLEEYPESRHAEEAARQLNRSNTPGSP